MAQQNIVYIYKIKFNRNRSGVCLQNHITFNPLKQYGVDKGKIVPVLRRHVMYTCEWNRGHSPHTLTSVLHECQCLAPREKIPRWVGTRVGLKAVGSEKPKPLHQNMLPNLLLVHMGLYFTLRYMKLKLNFNFFETDTWQKILENDTKQNSYLEHIQHLTKYKAKQFIIICNVISDLFVSYAIVSLYL
jgi:hypothetical protein